MKKYRMILSLVAFLIIAAILFIPQTSYAFCPVCTVAIGAGLGLSRWLKVDDVISGLWIGALILSSAMWLVNWLETKGVNFPGLLSVSVVFSYAVVIIPLYSAKIMGHPGNKIFGLDKLLFGIGVGSVVFMIGLILHAIVKKINNGKQLFYFQKVVSPVLLLAIFSLAFYYIIKRITYGL